VNGLVIDLFAGGGGASTGIEAALRRHVDIAINHDPLAIAVHKANHPNTQHLTCDIWEARPREVVRGRNVWALWASPDCTDHSNAKGGKPRRQHIRSLADVVIRWAAEVSPEWIYVENVPEFRGWGPLDENGQRCKLRKGEEFARWCAELRALGYALEYRDLTASHYGAPTRRRRLFIVARRGGGAITWPAAMHGPTLQPLRTAAECIDWNLPCPSIFERRRPLAEKTLWRIAQGLRRFVFENPRPFIIKANHGKWEPRHEDIDAPLSTVTASQRGHALVVPTLQQSGFGEREGQRARVLDLDKPLTTIVAKGQKHALIAAFLAKHFGDPLRADGGGGVVVGSELDEPIGTVTARDHHSLAAVTLAQFRGTSSDHPGCADPREPMPTISAGGDRGGVHVAEVRAFLTAYYGSDGTGGQQLTLPLRTITGRDRLGLVMVAGTEYQIVDIGMRMLQPHELLRAQFGKYANGYDIRAAKSKKAKVKLIGNSVCPEVAEALVRANLGREIAEAA
jgi:DNA (cytosine-5)-methyltransferase 1